MVQALQKLATCMERGFSFLKLNSREERFLLCHRECKELQNSKTPCLGIVYVPVTSCRLTAKQHSVPQQLERWIGEGRMPTVPVENVALGLLPGQEHAFAYKSSKGVCEQCIQDKIFLNAQAQKHVVLDTTQDYSDCRRKLLTYVAKCHRPTSNIVYIRTFPTDFQIY